MLPWRSASPHTTTAMHITIDSNSTARYHRQQHHCMLPCVPASLIFLWTSASLHVTIGRSITSYYKRDHPSIPDRDQHHLVISWRAASMHVTIDTGITSRYHGHQHHCHHINVTTNTSITTCYCGYTHDSILPWALSLCKYRKYQFDCISVVTSITTCFFWNQYD